MIKWNSNRCPTRPAACFFRRITTSCSPFIRSCHQLEIRKRLALTPLRVYLAHLAFHPPVQNRLAKFPAITQFERRDFTFGDIAVERVRADSQILRRLPHIHHFARFAHSGTQLRRPSFRIPLVTREARHARTCTSDAFPHCTEKVGSTSRVSVIPSGNYGGQAL